MESPKWQRNERETEVMEAVLLQVNGACDKLKEETNLDGKVVNLLGNCSHFNSIFGDILLLGIEMKIDNWSNLKVGDDASEAAFYNFNNHLSLAFECHIKILNMYIDTL